MSNTKKVVLILTAVFLACMIVVAIIIGITFQNSGTMDWKLLFGGSKFDVDERETFNLDGINTVSVDSTSGDVYIIESDEMKAELTGTIIAPENQDKYLKVYEQNGTLHIDVKTEFKFWVFQSNLDLKIYLPNGYDLDLKVDSTSGDIEMANFDFVDINIIKTSGYLKMSDCSGDTMRYESSSGNTNISNSRLTDVNITSTSGDVHLDNVIGDIMVRSTSGRVNIIEANGAVDIGSTSGDVLLDMATNQIEPITVGITSGDLTIKMFDDTAFEFEAQTTSGDISSDIDIIVSGKLGKSFAGDKVSGQANGGGARITANTTSGDIRIIKK